MALPDWSAVRSLEAERLTELFARDSNRVATLSADVAGIHFDWSKTHLTAEMIAAFSKIAADGAWRQARRAVRRREDQRHRRPRGGAYRRARRRLARERQPRAQSYHARMRALIDAIEAEAFGPIRSHPAYRHRRIGAGPRPAGRCAGPRRRPLRSRRGLQCRRRRAGRCARSLRSAGDADRHRVEDLHHHRDDAQRRKRAPGWMQGGVEDPYGRSSRSPPRPKRRSRWGVDETRVLPFSESVGGRYSLWSSIGFPAALALGWDAFEELLEGAAEMDRHFRLAPFEANAPVLAAFADLYYTQVRGCETRATFAYDERLRLLPSYLQQLEMESNGKRVTAEGQPVLPDRADHLGRRRHRCAACGVPAAPPGHPPGAARVHRLDRAGRRLAEEHHRQLLLNMFAQGAALMAGRKNDDLARDYPGDRPSRRRCCSTRSTRARSARCWRSTSSALS
jgi:glucose-6-phosphate isomerase